MTVGDVCNRAVIIVKPDASVIDAVRLMTIAVRNGWTSHGLHAPLRITGELLCVAVYH